MSAPSPRDAATGTLRPLNDQSTHGAAPCYVSLDPSGRYVLVANYSGGTVAVLPIAAGGRLEAATCVIHYQGSSIRPEQEGPHPHMIRPSADGRFVLVTDLGTDQVLVYRLDTSTGQLAPNGKAWPWCRSTLARGHAISRSLPAVARCMSSTSSTQP